LARCRRFSLVALERSSPAPERLLLDSWSVELLLARLLLELLLLGERAH